MTNPSVRLFSLGLVLLVSAFLMGCARQSFQSQALMPAALATHRTVAILPFAVELERLREEGLLESADMPMLFTRLARRHPVRILYFSGHWMDVDSLPDLAVAQLFVHHD